ncbi:MAG: FKBP-type peptidyl-prolyl cis-trans isomerase [Ignavibacteriae bacterium]|nr:FKBP-type peptidyl-prolyl cis-trans isomerase [Ignavibacteriota bacterium]
MKFSAIAVFCLYVIAMQACSEEKPKEGKTTVLKTPKDKISYSIGVQIGKNLSAGKYDIDTKIMYEALNDAYTSGKLLMTEEEIAQTMQQSQADMAAKQEAEAKKAGEEARKKGAAFLEENKKKPGVVTTASGLQYLELKAGTGASPKPDQTIVAHYTGTLLNGKKFDSSVDKGQPLEIRVTDVIKGWTEAMMLMKVGAKWKIFIPADLAYGDRGAPGGVIGPGETIIFEVELLGIK